LHDRRTFQGLCRIDGGEMKSLSRGALEFLFRIGPGSHDGIPHLVGGPGRSLPI